MRRMAGQEGASAPVQAPGGAVRYHKEKLKLASRESQAELLTMVPAGARVLELGPATGSMTEHLRAQGCEVTVVEADAEAAAQASAWCDRALVADLDQVDLVALVGEGQYGAVVAADVLEHLKDPMGVLRQVARVLAPGGVCLVSVPNVAHGAVRLALLEGRWEYAEFGLLDRTHLRFFTRAGVRDLFARSGFAVAEIRTVERPLTGAQVDFDPALLEGPIGEFVAESEDATTFQFVVRATPDADGTPRRTYPRSLQDEQSRLIASLIRDKRAYAECVGQQYSALKDQAARITHLTTRLEKREAQLTAHRRQVRRLRKRLAKLHRSRSLRLARLAGSPVRSLRRR